MAATFEEALATVRAGSLSADLRYDDFYSDSNRSPDEFFQDWFDEQARA